MNARREREQKLIQAYRAEVLEGIASYVEQIPVAKGASALTLQSRIVLDIRESK